MQRSLVVQTSCTYAGTCACHRCGRPAQLLLTAFLPDPLLQGMSVIVKATPNSKFRPEKVAYYKEQVMI